MQVTQCLAYKKHVSSSSPPSIRAGNFKSLKGSLTIQHSVHLPCWTIFFGPRLHKNMAVEEWKKRVPVWPRSLFVLEALALVRRCVCTCMLGGDHFGSRPSVRPANVGCLSFPLPPMWYARQRWYIYTHKRALIATFFLHFQPLIPCFHFSFCRLSRTAGFPTSNSNLSIKTVGSSPRGRRRRRNSPKSGESWASWDENELREREREREQKVYLFRGRYFPSAFPALRTVGKVRQTLPPSLQFEET